MTRLPTRVFGILMSPEAAIGALIGALMLGQHLTRPQQTAIAAVMLASAGASMTGQPVPALQT